MSWPLALSLFLFLVAPFFRKWVDLVAWPRIADWWASLSKKRLLKQIQQLEYQIVKPAIFHDLVIMITRRIALMLGLWGLVAIINLPSVNYVLQYLPPPSFSALPSSHMIKAGVLSLILLVISCSIGLDTWMNTRKMTMFRTMDEQRAYVDALQARIEHLKSKLDMIQTKAG